jgi:dihydroxyacid dehydratase/phosphogluconate dehydratase
MIELDIDGRRLELDVPQEEIDHRIAERRPPPPRYTRA